MATKSDQIFLQKFRRMSVVVDQPVAVVHPPVRVQQTRREHFINGLSGLIAGACGIFVGHPFDTIKIRLQVGDLTKKATVSNGGIRELYRGLIPPLCTAGLSQFMVFTIYEDAKLQLRSTPGTYGSGANGLSNLSATFIAATIAGSITSYVMAPFQLVKVQQQSSSTQLTLRGCLKNIIHQHGVRGLFHGSTSVLFVEGIGRGVYMLTYEYVKAFLAGKDSTSEGTLQNRAIAASCAGSFSWFVMYPLDSIKSRRLSNLNSKSSYECFLQTWRGGGVAAFYRGCGFAMIRSVPVAATILPLYEHCREVLNKAI